MFVPPSEPAKTTRDAGNRPERVPLANSSPRVLTRVEHRPVERGETKKKEPDEDGRKGAGACAYVSGARACANGRPPELRAQWISKRILTGAVGCLARVWNPLARDLQGKKLGSQ